MDESFTVTQNVQIELERKISLDVDISVIVHKITFLTSEMNECPFAGLITEIGGFRRT